MAGAGKGNPRVFTALGGMLTALGCGAPPQHIQQTGQALVAVHTTLLPPGQPAAIDLTSTTPLPKLTIAEGTLPAGLTLGADDVIRGSPTNPGEYQRVVIAAADSTGTPLGSQLYMFAVGGGTSTLAPPQAPMRQGDDLTFDGITWNQPLAFAFVWDPQLNLLWPLRAGGSLAGQTLAPAGTAEALIVNATGGHGQFDLPLASMDPRVETLVQLTWDGDMDLDLDLLPDSSLNEPSVVEGTQILDSEAHWAVSHALSSSTAPGPEAIIFSDTAPVGRYALVALKKSGPDAQSHLYLEMRARAGTVLGEQEIDATLSDSATGSLADELSSGRQSWQALGNVDIATGGAATYTPPDANGDLFPPSTP